MGVCITGQQEGKIETLRLVAPFGLEAFALVSTADYRYRGPKTRQGRFGAVWQMRDGRSGEAADINHDIGES